VVLTAEQFKIEEPGKIEIPEIVLPKEEIPEAEFKPEIPPEMLKKVEEISKEFILRFGFRSLGEFIAFWTKIEKMKFEEEELSALVAVWSPYLPYIPSWVVAIIVTVVIFGKKVAIYREAKK